MRMTSKDYFIALLLGAIYLFLLGYLTGHTMTWGDPSSWYEFWGRSNASAVSRMQIFHSIGVVLAVLPVAILISWRYQTDWLRPILIVAAVASTYMLIQGLRGAWLLAQMDIEPSGYGLVSGAIDVVKVGLIPLLVTALFRRLVPLGMTPDQKT